MDKEFVAKIEDDFEVEQAVYRALELIAAKKAQSAKVEPAYSLGVAFFLVMEFADTTGNIHSRILSNIEVARAVEMLEEAKEQVEKIKEPESLKSPGSWRVQ